MEGSKFDGALDLLDLLISFHRNGLREEGNFMPNLFTSLDYTTVYTSSFALCELENFLVGNFFSIIEIDLRLF